uniref:Glycosyl transferase family 11 n=1 Tax=viral metagenome TaxID=1070528 RepID=A0A6C0JGB9_9ZZZZ
MYQPKTVSCYLMGGLGNQLFQIFTTMAYSMQNRIKTVFPYSDVLTVGIERPTYWNSFLKNLVEFTTANSGNNLSNDDLYQYPVIREPHHHYFKLPTQDLVQDNTILFGYYQSHKYFENEKDALFSFIELRKQQIAVKNEFSSYFDNDCHTISMHFRLGDYKEKQDYHPIMPYEYYENALFNILCFQINRPFLPYRVLYFCESEDNDIVSSHIESLKTKYSAIEFVKVDDKIEDWKQLLLMSCCENNIIANSSFSWWAGYFNQNKDKFVCYPHVWFGPKANNILDDMFPIEWNHIKW